MLPVRLGYQPQGMVLQEYWINKAATEAIVKYACGEEKIHIYISKDYDNSSVNYKIDGVVNEVINMSAMRMDVPVYQYEDTKGDIYFQVSFEYLNTYYSIDAMMEKDEFKKLLENLIIKNV